MSVEFIVTTASESGPLLLFVVAMHYISYLPEEGGLREERVFIFQIL